MGFSGRDQEVISGVSPPPPPPHFDHIDNSPIPPFHIPQNPHIHIHTLPRFAQNATDSKNLDLETEAKSLPWKGGTIKPHHLSAVIVLMIMASPWFVGTGQMGSTCRQIIGRRQYGDRKNIQWGGKCVQKNCRDLSLNFSMDLDFPAQPRLFRRKNRNQSSCRYQSSNLVLGCKTPF